MPFVGNKAADQTANLRNDQDFRFMLNKAVAIVELPKDSGPFQTGLCAGCS